MIVAEQNALKADNRYLKSQVAALEQLLEVHEYTVLEQTAKLEESLRQVRERTSDLAKVNVDLQNANVSMRQLTAAMEQSMDGIAMTEMEGRVTFANEAWADMHGWNVNELVGQHISAFYTTEQMATEVEPHNAEVTEKGAHEGEVSHVTMDGIEFPTQMSTSCLKDPAGSVVGMVSIARDITDNKKAEVELARVHRELLQVSRMAGMSEVATGVLHNVGNVLNSVNVAANLVAERVRKSRVTELKKAGDVVAEHVDDMVAFVADHPQGKHMARFMIEIAKHLVHEQQEILGDIAGLRKNIDHIKEIVATQQSYARVSGVLEESSPQELIEEALCMHSASFSRHQIEIVREHCELSSIMVDRHRLVQILVNLLGNAKHAMSNRDSAGGTLTLRTSLVNENRIRFEVTDDGMGIPKENLTKIFNFGFTTKKGGHGFGLHIGALVAKEMGGALTVHSDGQNAGATFALELPLQQETPSEVVI